MLQEQTQQLTQALQQTLTKLSELGDSVKQLGDSVKRVDTRLDAAEAASRKAQADQKLLFDSLATDVRIVREGTQNVNMRIGILSDEVEAIRVMLPRLAAPQTTTSEAGPDAAPTTDLAPAQAATATPASRTGLTPNRLYTMAMSDYSTGDYRLAISGFQNLLNDWSKSDLADDAQYYIGYSYLQMKRYPEAAKAFSDVIANYPSGDRVPEAYVDLGQMQRLMGQIDEARTSWQTVIKKFPSSSSAIIAGTKLDGLQQTAPPKP
jgi:tol-pal system protein YbgF